jgi:protein-S-isoprenylcysteine O-methyltransferase Ste14
MSAELFVLITLVVAWRAEKWQPMPALEWRDFGYAPEFIYLFSAMLIGLAAWLYITAEIELRRHGYGTLGSMAINEGGFGFTRHPQYFSIPLFMVGVGMLTDSRWVFIMLVVNFMYCHCVLIPLEEAWLEETHPELFAEHIKTGPSFHRLESVSSETPMTPDAPLPLLC